MSGFSLQWENSPLSLNLEASDKKDSLDGGAFTLRARDLAEQPVFHTAPEGPYNQLESLAWKLILSHLEETESNLYSMEQYGK